MTIYNYPGKDYDIENDLYPINTHLCIEYGTDIYFVPFQDTLTIRKLDTTDGTSSLIVTELGAITKFFYDRDNDKLYYYYAQANFSYIDLTDDTITDLTPTLDACEDLFVYDGDLFAIDTDEDDLTYYKYNAGGPSWGAVGTISEGKTNIYDITGIGDNDSPKGVCFASPYYYITDGTGWIFRYALTFLAVDASYDVSTVSGGLNFAPIAIEWVDPYFYVSDDDGKVYKYNATLTNLEATITPSGIGADIEDMCWGGTTYFYVVRNDGNVYKTNTSFVNQLTISVDGSTSTGITTNGDHFFVYDRDNYAYEYNSDFTILIKKHELSAVSNNIKLTWDGRYFFGMYVDTGDIHIFSSDMGFDIGTISYIAIISNNAYVIYKYPTGSSKIYVKDLDDSTNPSLLETIATTILIPQSENQRGISVGSDNNTLYFVMKDSTDLKTYLYTYIIDTDILTKGSEYNIALTLNRNTSSTATVPFNLEKGFGVETSVNDLMIYQIARTGTQLYKIGDLSNSTDFLGFVIMAITDTYLILYDGTDSISASSQDIAAYIAEAEIYHAERDYPTARILYDSTNYYLEESMFVQFIGNVRVNGSTSVDVRFEGYVLANEDEDDEAVVMKEVDLVSPALFDLLKSFSGTLEEGGFDDWLDVLITSFKYITKGTFDAATITLPKLQRDSEKSNAVFIDQGAVGEEFTWRIRPTGELDWTDGTDDSGINYDQDTPIYEVEVTKKQITANSITVKGGFFGGSQISSEADQGQDYPSQQANGIIEEEITIAWISTVALANSYANALLGRLGIIYTIVKFTVQDLTNGFIPPAEEITLEDTNKEVTSGQYKINQVIFNEKSNESEYIVSSTVRWDIEDLKGSFQNELADQVNQINERTMVKTGWGLGISYSDCTLAFSTPTFTLTLVAASMSYWIDGKLYTFDTNQTVNITDTEGEWYIYFDGDTLTASQSVWSIKAGDKALVAIMYYNADANTARIFWEFHSYETSPADHAREHYSKGTVFASGFVLSEASELISLTEGAGYDEDILINVSDGGAGGLFEQELTPGEFPVWYRSGATAWRIHAATTLPVYDNAGGDNVHYNQFSTPNWLSTASQGANRYVAYWICLTNEITEPIISLMGQTEPALLATAQDLTFNDLDLTGLPFQEITQLWKIIYKTNSTYVESEDLRGTNTPGGVYIPPASQISDEAFSIAWEGITTIGASKDALYNIISSPIVLKQEETTGTNGGTYTAGAWRTRPINVEYGDSQGYCAIGTDDFVLAAGTYLITGYGSTYSTGTRCKARLYNVTGSAVLVEGISGYFAVAEEIDYHMWLSGVFTIAASQTLEFQMIASSTQASNGMGLLSNLGTSEVFAELILWRIG